MSQSNPPNYIEDVPVKIFEKYKPPPIISLPHSILNRFKTNHSDDNDYSEDNDYYWKSPQLQYDFTLERNVLFSIEHWKKVRENERENRLQCRRRYELERAREIEENQKQLLTAVSYPSTEELSSSSSSPSTPPPSDDEESISHRSAAVSRSGGTGNETAAKAITQFRPSQQCFDTILMPTVVPESYHKKKMNSFMKEITAATAAAAATTTTGTASSNATETANINVNNINYSDFENDTSSPFDNIELKTINDLDILAQVLNITQLHSKEEEKISNTITTTAAAVTTNTVTAGGKDESNRTDEGNSNEYYCKNETNLMASAVAPIITSTITTSPTFGGVSCINGNGINQNQTIPAPFISHHTFLQNATSLSYQQQQQLSSQNYSNLGIVGCVNNSRSDGASVANIKNDFYYYNNLPNNQLYNGYICASGGGAGGNSTSSGSGISGGGVSNYLENLDISNLDIQQLQQQQNYHRNLLNQINYGMGNHSTSDVHASYSEPSIIQTARNKSKSVPDILKELNDEIADSEKRRSKNNEIILEDNNKGKSSVDATPVRTTKLTSHNHRSHRHECKHQLVEQIPESFLKLSPSLQRLVKNISLMGFPLERVSKIAERLGNDDKKIFEHLIPLSELLDLGFEESKISEALLRFDNNKEKALDFLIS